MDAAPFALIASAIWFVVYLGYVLVAGMGTFWAFVWPEGQSVRRLRGVAVTGIALIGLGTLAEVLVVLLVDGYPRRETIADESGMWLLVRLAVLAVGGFFGAELLRRPVRRWRRLAVLALIVTLTITLVVESTVTDSPRVGATAAAMAAYLLTLAAWLGSLVALVALLMPRNRPTGLDRVWPRFSWFGGLSVLVLAATMSAQHLLVSGTATSRSTVLLLVEVPVLVVTWALSRYAVAYGKRVAFRERYLPGAPVERDGQRPRLVGAIGLQIILAVALVGMATQVVVVPAPVPVSAGVPGRPAPPSIEDAEPTTPISSAREARPADSDTPRFIPEQIQLPGGTSAAIVPVATVGNELVVPEDGTKVGWWDGSSYVGDPFGSTVIAGHVDTLTDGIGYFFQLWNIKVGARVMLSAGDARQAYKITTLREVARSDLVDDDEAFDIGGPPRLVLITCAGDFRADRGGYSRNLIVVARPIS